MQVLEMCRVAGIDIADLICARARVAAAQVVPRQVDVEIWAIDRRGVFIGHAGFERSGAGA
jgi:cobalt-precorrin-5B (C1)-methyltransferase